MRTDDLDFLLPPELIAQEPAGRRSAARLMTWTGGEVGHRHVSDLPALLRAGDLLVLNDTRVRPARFACRKPTGGVVEGLWLADLGPGEWRVLLKNPGPVRPEVGFEVVGDPAAKLFVLGKLEQGYRVRVEADGEVLASAGRMPLPPYIKRGKTADARDDVDRERYQTVFGQGAAASVAAPTAGLHFDDELLQQLDDAGVRRTTITLEVGAGTFAPVTADDLDDHAMHTEQWHLPPAAAEAINGTKRDGRRIVCVGTTSCRTLESQPPGEVRPGSGETSLLIQPPYEPKHVDVLLTNFHLPRSTLIALVDGLIGTPTRRRLYDEAISEKYRFFSYGDAMLLTLTGPRDGR
jgi:S-adenosylmethionine:tRNA ribosyltransferase-isomerase